MNLKVIADIMRAMKDLAQTLQGSAAAMHRDIDQLIAEIAATLLTLEEVRAHLAGLASSPDKFRDGFPEFVTYYRKFYVGRANLSKARTHCSDVKRNVKRIDFKLTTSLTSDVGRTEWARVQEAIHKLTDNDELIKDYYLVAMQEVQVGVAAVERIFQRRPNEAWQKFQAMNRRFTKRLDGLNDGLTAMSEAQLIIRQHVG